jgi:hypothetical protein
MPLTVDEFLKSLRDLGICSPKEVAALEKRLPSEQRTLDAQALAAELVRRQRLTQFQAATLCASDFRLQPDRATVEAPRGRAVLVVIHGPERVPGLPGFQLPAEHEADP